MAASAFAPSAAAPAKWTLTQVVRFWHSGEPGFDRDYEDEDRDDSEGFVETKKAIIGYVQKLSSMGVESREQAQSVLTDELCCTLNETHGLACDLRRELLDLLGVQWRQQVWSASEVAVWERRPVEPTSHADDGPWREECDEFKKLSDKLGLDWYWRYFSVISTGAVGPQQKLLASATARNFLYYLCGADFRKLGIPAAAAKALRTEALSGVFGDGSARQLALPDLQVVPEVRRSKSHQEMFKESIEQLREWLAKHDNEYPKRGSSEPRERYLATFMNRMREKHKSRKLDDEQAKVLIALPSWSFSPRVGRWMEMHDAARDLLQKQVVLQKKDQLRSGRKEAVRYPSKSSLTAHDRKLGQWLADQRRDLTSSTEMSVNKRTLLQSLPEWESFLEPGGSSKKGAESKRHVDRKVVKNSTGAKAGRQAAHSNMPAGQKRKDAEAVPEVSLGSSTRGASESSVPGPRGIRLRIKTSPEAALERWAQRRYAR